MHVLGSLPSWRYKCFPVNDMLAALEQRFVLVKKALLIFIKIMMAGAIAPDQHHDVAMCCNPHSVMRILHRVQYQIMLFAM